MKKLAVMEERIAKIAKEEESLGCCSFRGECGMMPNARCETILLLLSSRNCSPLKYLKIVISIHAIHLQQMTDVRPCLINVISS